MLSQQLVVPPPAVFLGELIAARRRELGHSQRDLAELLCAASGRPTVTRHEISRYERETRVPAGPAVALLAAVLDLPVSQVRQAAALTRMRRRLFDIESEPGLDVCPGYLFDAQDSPQPRTMLLITGGPSAR